MTTLYQDNRSAPSSVEAEYAGKHEGSVEHIESAAASNGAAGAEGAYEFTPEQEKRVVRKMDRHIVPLLWSLYLLSVLDRSNVGNAKVAGMGAELKLSSDQYQWLLTIFYIAYVCFEFFPIMWKIVPPHIWAAIAVTSWGVVSTAQAATTNWTGMMICRFFLGMAEAAFGPGVPFFLSFFYHRYELGTRVGLFLSAAPLANCFAGALAYGITSGHTIIAPWRVLFLVEGIPTILMGIVVFFFLPDSPAKARFLNDEDRKIIAARQYRQVGDQAGKSRTGSVNFHEIFEAMTDLKNLYPALMYFCTNVGFSSLPVFLPQILNDMGFSSINAQGLTAPPYFVAFLAVISSTYLADKLRQRGLVMITVSLTGALGYIILAVCTSTAARYAGVFFAAIGVFSAIMNVIPWIINNQGSDTKRGAGVAILNLVGQCGPLLGTRVFPASDAPFYRTGMWVSASFLLFNAVLALTYRTILARANKKLDEKYPAIEGQTTGHENEGPAFRYAV